MLALIKRIWDAYNFAGSWTVHYFYFNRQLETGEHGKGYLACKKVDGRWIYRHATPEEVDEELRAEAW